MADGMTVPASPSALCCLCDIDALFSSQRGVYLEVHVIEDLSLHDLERCRRHRVTISGNRGPVVVLQHGFGTDQTCWDNIVPELISDHRVVRMDLAGASSPEAFDAGQYDRIEAHADDLLAVLHELRIEECIFVGASVGGMVGILAAIAQPSLFRKLICIAGSPRYLNDGAYFGGFEQVDLDGLYAAMHEDFQGWISGFARMVVRGSIESSAVSEFSRSLFRYRPDIALSMARTIFQSDYRGHLSLLETPTVLLQTENDAAVPAYVGEYMRQHIRDSKLEVLPVEGHFPHLVAPEIVAGALRRHLT
jgi:sigma-B regulation protein RsbQ